MSSTPTISRVSRPNDSQLVVRMPSNVANPEGEERPKNEKQVSDGSPTNSESGEPEFQEGGYGWVVVLSVWLINAHTWGLNSSFAVFLAYYLRNNLFSGGTPLTFAFVGGLSISIALLLSPLATVCIAKYGTVTTLRIGVIFVSASFIGASFTSEIWHLLLSQGMCFGIGMGFSFTASVGVVPQWFTKQRSFANAVSTSGSGFGGLTYSLATNALISNLGLPWAFRIVAIVSFVANGVASLLIRDRNKAVGAVHVAFHVDLFKRREVWLYMLWGFFAMISYVIVVFSLADYASQVGFTPSQGSIVSAMFNLSQGVGRPIIGLVSDKIGRMNVAGLSTLVAGLAAFFIWIFAGKSYAGLIIYALFGMFAGALWPTVAPVGAEVVGLQLLPAALSIYWVFLVLPATFAEPIGLGLKTAGVDGYLHVQAFAGTLYIASFLCIWLLRSWKIHEVESLHLSEQEREADIQDDDVAQRISSRRSTSARQPMTMLSYFRNMFKVQRI
ncbi:MFS general substrate transporter [Thozetella sp. PMI_491]|nr:MFS general substrate transporter [Thozetella sp. PMI_491]